MKIFEVEQVGYGETPSPDKLMGLVQFLAGRAEDSNSQKEISQDAFIKLAQSLGVNVTRQNLPDLVGQPPLSNLLEPLTPDSDEPVVYKGGEPQNVKMPVNKAQDVVANAAKKAAAKDRGI